MSDVTKSPNSFIHACTNEIHNQKHISLFGYTYKQLEKTRHIDKLANKISPTLGILNKLKHVLPEDNVQCFDCATFQLQ